MIGRQDRKQRHLFITGDIDHFIPEDNILRRVDRGYLGSGNCNKALSGDKG